MLEACVNLEPGVLEYEESELLSRGPVWILGRRYSGRGEEEELRKDVQSRLWFTYRRGFGPIGGTGPCSDQGWGCMLRCGQMLLAEALSRLRLGRDWRWKADPNSLQSYQDILQLFLDVKSRPFSLHQIAQMGVSEGKEVGEWFGPNTAAQVLKKLVALESDLNLEVVVALDNCLMISDVEAACGGSSEGGWRPLLLIVPLRLGLSSLNPCYIQALKAYLEMSGSLGILGGRPQHALWLIGAVESEAIYLDPHYCQDHVGEVTEDESFHCGHLLSQSLAELDPSLALAFIAEDEAAFRELVREIRTHLLPASQPPLFEVLDQRPSWYPSFQRYTGPSEAETPGPSSYAQLNSDSDEDFEILQ